MSKSKKHTPIWAFASASSEKYDKKILHGKLRTRLRVAVKECCWSILQNVTFHLNMMKSIISGRWPRMVKFAKLYNLIHEFAHLKLDVMFREEFSNFDESIRIQELNSLMKAQRTMESSFYRDLRESLTVDKQNRGISHRLNQMVLLRRLGADRAMLSTMLTLKDWNPGDVVLEKATGLIGDITKFTVDQRYNPIVVVQFNGIERPFKTNLAEKELTWLSHNGNTRKQRNRFNNPVEVRLELQRRSRLGFQNTASELHGLNGPGLDTTLYRAAQKFGVELPKAPNQARYASKNDVEKELGRRGKQGLQNTASILQGSNGAEGKNISLYQAALKFGVKLPQSPEKGGRKKIYTSRKIVIEQLRWRQEHGLGNSYADLTKPKEENGDSTLYMAALREGVNYLDFSQNAKGGIDFNSNKLNLQIQNAGKAIRFNIDPAMLRQLQNAPGFTPVIISIHPVNIRAFLGLADNLPAGHGIVSS